MKGNSADKPAGKPPVFKMERGPEKNRTLVIMFAVAAFVCIALYITGVMTSNFLVTAASMVLAITVAILGTVTYKTNNAAANRSPEEIDGLCESYEDDLRRTFIGYDVSYTESDIEAAVAEYRAELERENEHVKANNPAEVASAVSQVFKDERADNKELRAEYKAAKKERKAEKRARREASR